MGMTAEARHTVQERMGRHPLPTKYNKVLIELCACMWKLLVTVLPNRAGIDATVEYWNVISVDVMMTSGDTVTHVPTYHVMAGICAPISKRHAQIPT